MLQTPAIELMAYLSMEMEKEQDRAEEEKIKMYIHYLSNVFSQPLTEKPSPKYMQAKREFEKLIQPEPPRHEPKKQAKIYEWDFEREARLQKEGGKA